MPYVFLMTDGAVKNEREICQYVGHVMDEAKAAVRFAPRISTIAVGRFCNHFFLKQLAVFGRGQFEVALRPYQIQQQTQRMLMASAQPVLTNLALKIEGASRRAKARGGLYANTLGTLPCAVVLFGRRTQVWSYCPSRLRFRF